VTAALGECSALEAANGVFHSSYADSREAAESQAPLLIVLADELALHVRGRRRSFRFSYALFHPTKVVAHVAVALYALTAPSEDEAVRSRAQLRIGAIREQAQTMLDWFRAEPAESHVELETLLESAISFAERAASGRGCSPEDRAAFARATGPQILKITEKATGGQLAALHEAVEAALSERDSDDQSTLEVVVLGDHQARARSFAMQYFQRRLREGEGADERVTYGENVTDEKAALALVATKRVDRDIAQAFFDDPKRLQRDVLGDAATACLDRMNLEEIR
jgi:hypothetical protein